MDAKWKILGIKSPDGELITEAKYFASISLGGFTVETEGNWTFLEPKLAVPFADVTEEMIVGWVKTQTMRDGANMIETRLAEQLAALQKDRETPLPWAPQVFTPKFEE
jgi:hypothetical protein